LFDKVRFPVGLLLDPLGGYDPDVPEWPGAGRTQGFGLATRIHLVMGKKLYVGNLPFSTTEDELRDLFERHGTVDSVKVITDRETGRPRGFAFVEMSEPSAVTDAIRALDGTQLGGRALKVNEAQDKPRPSGGGGGGGRGPGGGGGRGPRY
jgi:RNA recognition motif-containing protein